MGKEKPTVDLVVLGHVDSTRRGFIKLEKDGATCEIELKGARVASWITEKGEQIYWSQKVQNVAPVRGGVPLCWPQFAMNGPLSKHGFVKPAVFSLVSTQTDRAKLSLVLRNHEDNGHFFSFDMTVDIVLTKHAIEIKQHIVNKRDEPLEYTACIHPYFNVEEIGNVQIISDRLKNARGVDKTGLKPNKAFVETTDTLTFDGKGTPMDTMYFIGKLNGDYLLKRNDKLGDIKIRAPEGYLDLTCWNIGAKDCVTIADMEDDDWKRYVCVEPTILSKNVMPTNGDLTLTTVFENI